MKLNNLIIRSITGIIFIILIIGSLITNNYLFGTIFLIFTILGMLEFYGIVEDDILNPMKLIGIIIGSIIYILIFSCTIDIKNILLIYLCIPAIFPIFIAGLFSKKGNPFLNISITILGIIYIAFPFSLLNIFLMYTQHVTKFPELLLMFFIVIWTYDTGAYLSGILLGRHKLFERISPKKTWEGLIGGLIITLSLTYILSEYFTYLSKIEWMLFSLITIISATFGDLSESLLKRSANIKDSGNIFPGHGGILDRFDSVFLAAPFTLIYIYIIEYIL